MKATRYTIRLNGIALDSIDKRIFPTDVKENAPKIKVTTYSKPLGGLGVTRRDVTTRSVSVRFVIWEKDKQARSALFQKVIEWADAGGDLSVGYRDAQLLRVLCEKLPDISGKDWSDELEITFTAYDPYWQSSDCMETTVTAVANTAVSATMCPDGTAEETHLIFEISNTASSAMTSVTVTVDGKSIALSGFSLAAGKKLIADYDENGYLRIKADGTSVLSKRSAASADELYLKQRQSNSVSITVDKAARVTLKAYARWK